MGSGSVLFMPFICNIGLIEHHTAVLLHGAKDDGSWALGHKWVLWLKEKQSGRGKCISDSEKAWSPRPATMVKAAPAPDLHVRITETTYPSAATKGNSSQVTSSSGLGIFFSGNSSVWPVMQNKFHGDQLKEKVKYHTELGFWGTLGITPRSKTVKPEETPP